MQLLTARGGVARLVVIAKQCVPGRVKTRLSPPFSQTEAASIAAASLAQTLDTARAVRVPERILLFDGSPDGLDLEGFRVLPQTIGGLDERIAAGFDDARSSMLLIGMDTPQVTTRLLQQVVDDEVSDSWFGPASDGGFWALGLREPNGDLVRGVPMSTALTGRRQLARLELAGLRPAVLPTLRDVDRAEDALEVAADVPGSGFAHAVRSALAFR